MLSNEIGTDAPHTSTPADRPSVVARQGFAKSPHVDSHRLMAGARELVIDHAGQEYRLRLTRNDKLILTK